ncbi:hypothetical protein V2J09_011750 [Rumex salicifolius]
MRSSLRSINSFLSNSQLSLNQFANRSNLVSSPLTRNVLESQIVAGAARPTLIQALSFSSSSKSNQVNNKKPSSDLVSDVSVPKQQERKRTTKIGIAIRSFDQPSNNVWCLPPHTKKIALPESRVVYTVLRSPHIDKKSREQFEMRIKKQYLVIETNRDELRKKFFWLKRQRIFGAQYEIRLSCKTRLDKEKLQSLISKSMELEMILTSA